MKKNKENKNQESELTDINKKDPSDIGNSLKRDAVGNRGANDYTPRGSTDIELGTEKRRHKI